MTSLPPPHAPFFKDDTPTVELHKDPINPAHYKSHPSGVEAIEIAEHMNFCLGNAIKYIWRAGIKGSLLEDLKKASWYLNREIARLENLKCKPSGAASSNPSPTSRLASASPSLPTSSSFLPPDSKDLHQGEI